MKTFKYMQEGDTLLSIRDLYQLFNDYRVWKYLIGMLIMLEKTDLPNYKILETGCGAGNKLRYFTELRTKRENCFGLDISSKAIDLSRALSPAGMNFTEASIVEMPYETAMFDIILCSNIFNCLSDEDIHRASCELRRVIKNDGVLMVLDVNELFITQYRNNEEVKAKGLRAFDTTKNELEGFLADKFTVFRRVNVFGAEYYGLAPNRYADIVDLPGLDQAMDKGTFPCPYTLYSFVPKS